MTRKPARIERFSDAMNEDLSAFKAGEGIERLISRHL